MNLGPIHITGEISVGSILTIITVLYTGIKYLSHIVIDFKIRSERLDKMWVKFNGEYENDPNAWFTRLEKMETKVTQMWQRLKFNRLSDARTRSGDGG